MELALCLLTGTIMASCFFLVYEFAYKQGYEKGKEEKEKEYKQNSVVVNKENLAQVREYMKMWNYTGGDDIQ